MRMAILASAAALAGLWLASGLFPVGAPRAPPDAPPPPPPLSCAEITDAPSCAIGVARLAGTLAGRSVRCDLPQEAIQRLGSRAFQMIRAVATADRDYQEALVTFSASSRAALAATDRPDCQAIGAALLTLDARLQPR